MPHEIERILAAAGAGPWAIDLEKAQEIVSVLALRADQGPQPVKAEGQRAGAGTQVIDGVRGRVHVLPLHGTILPRGGMLAAMSGATGLSSFQTAFREAAGDQDASAIVLEVDSPGGRVDLVQETAAMIYAARRADRPIVASANTFAASAAYWIAAAADQLVVTPSGTVGSIGVYTMHDDLSERLKQMGVKRTVVREGPRKAERLPFGPMSAEAQAATQREVRATYEQFTSDVARFRGVAVDVVRADPEQSAESFGGGRAYHAREAVRRGMADRVEAFPDTLARLTRGPRTNMSTQAARMRLA